MLIGSDCRWCVDGVVYWLVVTVGDVWTVWYIGWNFIKQFYMCFPGQNSGSFVQIRRRPLSDLLTPCAPDTCCGMPSTDTFNKRLHFGDGGRGNSLRSASERTWNFKQELWHNEVGAMHNRNSIFFPLNWDYKKKKENSGRKNFVTDLRGTIQNSVLFMYSTNNLYFSILKIWAVCYWESSVYLYQTTRCHLHSRRR